MPVDSGWPASRFAALLDRGALQNQNQLDADLQGWLSEEHKANGEHGNIVADSITINPYDPSTDVSGKVIIQDEDAKQTQFYRTRALETLIDMVLGNTLTLRTEDYKGLYTSLVKLGIISHGSGSGNGIEFGAIATGLPDSYHDWSIVSGNTNVGPGARLLIGDITRSIAPISLRWRNTGNGFYEWMKTVGAEGPLNEAVTLGSGLDASLVGYWDAAYIKSLNLQTATTNHAVAGAWADVAFSAGNFTGFGSMTWTVASGDQRAFAYMFVGASLTVSFMIETSTVGGTPSTALQIAIPGGFTVAGRDVLSACYVNDNGTTGLGQILAPVGGSLLQIFKADGSNWSAATDTTYVRGQITFAIA